ncbi:hypothetical protein [Phenylobacterium sp.]|uniref:hypothetical protein n=1 Tax=Phenylobacterium sp. TaxID=1871053 RepID=UPI002F3F3C9A
MLDFYCEARRLAVEVDDASTASSDSRSVKTWSLAGSCGAVSAGQAARGGASRSRQASNLEEPRSIIGLKTCSGPQRHV